MYIDNQVKQFRVMWSEHIRHAYDRISRSKWEIRLSYACGAEMVLENQPDDLIQCLVLGAFNSRMEIKSDVRDVLVAAERTAGPVASWREFQELLLDEQ